MSTNIQKFKDFFTSDKIKICFKNILLQILFIIIFSFLFLSDDYIFKIFNKSDKVVFSLKYFFLVFVLSSTILFIKNKKIIYVILSVFCFIELTQLTYLSYFGVHMHPAIIPLIFKEVLEIQETGFASIDKVYYAFLAVLIPYSIMILLIKKNHSKLYTFKFAWIIFIVFVSLVPIRAIRKSSIVRSLANPYYPSIYNSLRVYSGYFFNILPISIKDQGVKDNFKKYEITKSEPLNNKMNLVLVFGESFNYYNQGLYGYKRDTTPNLSKLAKENKNFIYKKGIACAVATQQSIPYFFNLQREPRNYEMQINMQANLFKLAKDQGFKTFFISAQSRGLSNNIGSQYVDVFISVDDESKLFSEKKEEALLELIKKQELGDKNFIVLHQRNLHSPYEKNYSYRKNDFEKYDDTYDNAILYNDYILNELINYFKNITENPLYLFITSDHNELRGQNGLFGHAILVPEAADVPIMLYINNANSEIQKELNNTFMPTHYELGLLIAKIMGYKIFNPNAKNNIYYINGNDTMGRFGYIEVIKDLENKKINYKIIE